MIVWQTTKKCILHYSMRSLTHWSRSNSRILAAQKTFSSPPSSKLRKSISPQKAKTVPFPSHARHGVCAVAAGNETQKIHGEAMYTAPDSAGCAALQDRDCQCAGSRGKAPRPFSRGLQRGILSFEKESIPLLRTPARCGNPPTASGRHNFQALCASKPFKDFFSSRRNTITLRRNGKKYVATR